VGKWYGGQGGETIHGCPQKALVKTLAEEGRELIAVFVFTKKKGEKLGTVRRGLLRKPWFRRLGNERNIFFVRGRGSVLGEGKDSGEEKLGRVGSRWKGCASGVGEKNNTGGGGKGI